MKIRLEDIPENGLDLKLPNSSLGHFNPDILSERDDEISFGPDLVGMLHMARDEDAILLSGNVKAVARLRCSRCLKEYLTDVETELDLVLKVTGSSLDEEAELEDNEIPISGPEIDLGQILSQELILELPMKPLCDTHCPGLCPRCGQIKGSEQCKCGAQDEIDPRWADLLKIKDKIS
ncbi:MAG: DUF177 domain-containing protein [Desulfomonilaceae bacterium]